MKNLLITLSIFTKDNTDPFNFTDGLDGLIDGIGKIFTIIFSIIDSIYDAVMMLYQSLSNIITWIDNMINGINTGNIDGLPVLGAVATYRYLVGDTIFYLTYVTVVTGCLLTIYNLFKLIYKEIDEINEGSQILSVFKRAKIPEIKP